MVLFFNFIFRNGEITAWILKKNICFWQNCFTTNFFSSSPNFFPDFFFANPISTTKWVRIFFIPTSSNYFLVILWQRMKFSFDWCIEHLYFYSLGPIFTSLNMWFFGHFWYLSQKKKIYPPPTFENLSKKNFCGKTEKICVLIIKYLWYNRRPFASQEFLQFVDVDILTIINKESILSYIWRLRIYLIQNQSQESILA